LAANGIGQERVTIATWDTGGTRRAASDTFAAVTFVLARYDLTVITNPWTAHHPRCGAPAPGL